MRSFHHRYGLLVAAAVAMPATSADPPATVTTTQTTQTTVETPAETTTKTVTREKVVETGKRAGEIATQPARDVGVRKITVPLAVQQAAAAPYSLKGLAGCRQLNAAIFQLNDALGPDYDGAVTVRENRAGKLAEAGGKTIVNTIIPFRGLVREVSGAAPAERRLNAAIRAAYARRGFLRGVAITRKCRLR